MKYEIYEKSKHKVELARLRLDPPDEDGGIDLVVVDAVGDHYETLLTFRADGIITLWRGIDTNGFKLDDKGHIVIEEVS